MDKHGLDYQLVNLDHEPAAVETLKSMGYRQVPVVMAEEDHWSGFRPTKSPRFAHSRRCRVKTMSTLVYFSSQSENTHRFVIRTGLPARRIPLDAAQRLQVDEPYILVVPSYGGGTSQGAVPKQVIQFLNDVSNRQLIRGVIAAGNRNFGEAYCLAGSIIAQKCQAMPVPLRATGHRRRHRQRLSGVTEFWQRQKVHS